MIDHPQVLDVLFQVIGPDVRLEHSQDCSTAAARRFADGTLDLVFLDADHGYEAMRADLQAWFGKVKRGKLLAGHDWDRGSWPGEVAAVEEFAAARGLPIQVEHELWSLQKL